VKFANFIRAYCLAGGYHIQVQRCEQRLLKAAQKTAGEIQKPPREGAGYSAYFTELNKEVQDRPYCKDGV
jgi:pyruvate-formate lyase